MKSAKVCFMPASALIDHCVQLKVDLIKAPSKMHSQGLAVVPCKDSSQEAGRQTPHQNARRAAIQPLFAQIEITSHAIPRYTKAVWQWLGRAQLTILGDRKEIHIFGCAFD